GIELVVSRYLGLGVNPDRKYGGYTSELTMLLDDLLHAGGDVALRQLFTHPRCDPDRLKDSRVVEALSWTLDCTLEQREEWVRSIANRTLPASEEHRETL